MELLRREKKSFKIIFSYFANLKGINCTLKLYKKGLVTVLVQELKTIVPLFLVHGLKNNIVFSECARALSPDNVIFMRNTGYAVQN